MERNDQRRMLVVEDNPINARYTIQVLARQGYAVQAAENGMEALELLRAQAFDLILMDVQMPEMDGVEATRRIRQELKLTTPILALTAHAMVGDKDTFLASGMDYYLSKPYTKADLLNALDEVAAALDW